MLSPLQAADADEMFGVLNDERLHEFTGGRPLTRDELQHHYLELAVGHSPDGNEVWLNWTVRLFQGGQAIGAVQAGVIGRTATIAWIIASPWQGKSYASEAAFTMSEWLERKGVTCIEAHIRHDHLASATVAERAGLRATDDLIDGEVVWRRVTSADRGSFIGGSAGRSASAELP